MEEECNAKNRIIVDENETTGIPKHIFVRDTVREKDMFYYKVPRLGSYLAIRLEFDSCLNEEAYDAAVENYIEVDQMNTNLMEEKKAWEEEQAELKRARQEQAEAEGEEEVPEFEPEERDWTLYEYEPFKTQKVQYCLCLNTMGQDREFTDEERLYALACVKNYRARWEQVEREQLRRDVEYKISTIKSDRDYKEYFEQKDIAEMEKKVKEAVAYAVEEKAAEGEEMTYADKEMAKRQEKWRLTTLSFYGPAELAEWRQR